MRVGIYTTNNPAKGLYRDAECLVWGLSTPPEFPRFETPEVSVFGVKKWGSAYAAECKIPGSVPVNTDRWKWLEGLDVVICCEVWCTDLVRTAQQKGVRVIYIPNIDSLGCATKDWIQRVRTSRVEVVAKTRVAMTVLQKHGIQPTHIPWSIPDPVCRFREANTREPLRLLFNAGLDSPRRGFDIVQDAARHFRLGQDIELTVKSVDRDLAITGARCHKGMWARDDLRRLYDDVDAVLYPSRWEGLGLSMLEALHAGVPVIATDGAPMNEIVVDGHNGRTVKAKERKPQALSPSWDPFVQDVVRKIRSLQNDPALRERLTCPQPGELVARQHAFRMGLHRLLRQQAPPRIQILHREPQKISGRTAAHKAQALRDFGYRADVATRPDGPADATFVGKRDLATVRDTARSPNTRPLFVWHQDYSFARPRRTKWTRDIQNVVDGLMTPDPPLRDEPTTAPHAQIPQSTNLRLTRPVGGWRAETHPNTVVLFMNYVRCLDEVQALVRAGFRVVCYGKARFGEGVEQRGAVYDAAQIEAIVQASGFTLSISWTNQEPHYTSARLYEMAGAGACVVAQRFPGCEDLYPEGVLWFDGAEDLVAKVHSTTASGRASLRQQAANVTWRHHSWHDRVSKVLRQVREWAG